MLSYDNSRQVSLSKIVTDMNHKKNKQDHRESWGNNIIALIIEGLNLAKNEVVWQEQGECLAKKVEQELIVIHTLQDYEQLQDAVLDFPTVVLLDSVEG